MMSIKRKRAVILYIRDMTPVSQNETAYVKKHDGLIKLIDEMMRLGNADTIEVTSQMSLGDNEKEFQQSLQRIKEAELFLKIGNTTLHPLDLPMLQWRCK